MLIRLQPNLAILPVAFEETRKRDEDKTKDHLIIELNGIRVPGSPELSGIQTEARRARQTGEIGNRIRAALRIEDRSLF